MYELLTRTCGDGSILVVTMPLRRADITEAAALAKSAICEGDTSSVAVLRLGDEPSGSSDSLCSADALLIALIFFDEVITILVRIEPVISVAAGAL
jgi:hypothetical protein